MGRPVGVARRWYMALPAGQRQHGRPPVGILGALLAGPDGDIWLCRRGGANMIGRQAEFGAPCWRGPTVVYGFAGGAAPTWSAAGRNLGRPVGVARRWIKALPEGRRQHGRPPGGILGALLAWPDGDIWLCRRGGANRSRRRQMAARNFCEDFAPRDGGTRPCGERGAKRAAEMPAACKRRRRISVKILLPETKPQGFAGSGEQIAYQKTAAESLPPLLTNLKTHYSACSSEASSFIISARDFR